MVEAAVEAEVEAAAEAEAEVEAAVEAAAAAAEAAEAAVAVEAAVEEAVEAELASVFLASFRWGYHKHECKAKHDNEFERFKLKWPLGIIPPTPLYCNCSCNCIHTASYKSIEGAPDLRRGPALY